MRVKLMKTFADAVGSKYQCRICHATSTLGWVQPVLVSDDEIPLGPLNRELQDALGIPVDPDDEELCEADRKRNAYWAARVSEFEPTPMEFGILCHDCVDKGPEYLERRLRTEILFLREALQELTTALEEGVTDVPTLEHVDLAARIYEEKNP